VDIHDGRPSSPGNRNTSLNSTGTTSGERCANPDYGDKFGSRGRSGSQPR
jgi:hypothetical protein